MRFKTLLAAVTAATLFGASSAQAAPCAGFTDVDSTNTFCPNVEWIKNRGVTLGCTSSTLYCPNDPVTRLAMAAFMQRLGDALLPTSAITTGVAFPDIDAALSAGPGPNGALVCGTPDLGAATYPRRAIVDITTSGSAIGVQGVRQRLAVSTDSGASWSLVNAGYWNKVSNIPNSTNYSMTSNYLYDVVAGQATRFAILLDRYDSSVVAGQDFASVDCTMRRVIISRTGAASPFDEVIEETQVVRP